MTEAPTTAQDVKTVATEVGKIVLKTTVQTAVEMGAAVLILGVVGLAASKVQERKAKKLAATQEESK